MESPGRSHAARRGRVLLVALVTTGATLLAVPGAAHAALLPPKNPPKSLAPSEAFLEACEYVSNNNATCIKAALIQIDTDRAAEHVGPMALPTTFTSLTTDEKIFVVANLERVDRGAAPVTGLSAFLDSYAQAGAKAGRDPSFPPGRDMPGGSTWSGGSNIFVADQGWMYNDGPGGINVDCTKTDTAGCWGHRDIILGAWPSPTLMGAGATTSGMWGGSVTQLFLGDDNVDSTFFTWKKVTPHLPVGLSATALLIKARRGVAGSVILKLFASGEKMDPKLSISSAHAQFSLNVSTCHLNAGSTCGVRVTFQSSSAGTFTGTIVVTGPNGKQKVAVTGVSRSA